MAIPGGDLRYTIGLDLGQSRNHTALVVMERVWHQATVAEFIASGTRGYNGEYRYTVVGAERLALGTPYPRVVSWVKSVAESYGGTLSDIRCRVGGDGWTATRGHPNAVGRGGDYGRAGDWSIGWRADDGGVYDGVADGVVDQTPSHGSGAAVSSG